MGAEVHSALDGNPVDQHEVTKITEPALEKLDVDHIDAVNLVYDDAEHEPELHLRTWIALIAMWFYNFILVFALFGPPVAASYIGESLDATNLETWIVNCLTLPQAVLCPLLSSVSDVFQIRKPLMIGTVALAIIGAAIVPGAQSINRLIAGQTLIGVGFAATPLGYAIPSEILPRRWRPLGQAWVNLAAVAAALSAPLIIGAFVKADPENGWRKYWWIEVGLWALAGLGLLFGYRPPKRHTRLDHLGFWQKVQELDLIGFLLFAAGLSMTLAGLSLGGQYSWTNARTLSTLIIGLCTLMAFFLFEWKGTSTGLLHHDMFHAPGMGWTFPICLALIFTEGILAFSYVVFYPILTAVLFTSDPFLLAARQESFYIGSLVATPIFGWVSTRLRRTKEPLAVTFLFFIAGNVGLATIRPGDDKQALVFAVLAGVGLGGQIMLVLATCQLATPHRLIATATAVVVSTRSTGTSIFTSIYVATFSSRLKDRLPEYIAQAAVKAGLPQTSVGAFVMALAGHDEAALSEVAGVTPGIITAGVAALKEAYADSLWVIFAIAAPIGLLGLIACFFMADLKKTMNYAVDAPVEVLESKKSDHTHGQTGE